MLLGLKVFISLLVQVCILSSSDGHKKRHGNHKRGYSACQANEECSTLKNCHALKFILDSKDVGNTHKILQERKCGKTAYCCPERTSQQPNEECTRLDMSCLRHITPDKLYRKNIEMLINRQCYSDPSKRLLGQRIYVQCPKPVCQPNEECIQLENCRGMYYNNYHQVGKVSYCATDPMEGVAGKRFYVCCRKPAFPNCQPNERCSTLENCHALKFIIESEDVRDTWHNILQERQCGTHSYCCPEQTSQQPNEECTRLDNSCHSHITPDKLNKKNIEMLINRQCHSDPSKRFLGQRIHVKCPKPVCQPNERCVGLNKCPHIHDIANNPRSSTQAWDEIYKHRLCTTNARQSYNQPYICCPEPGNFLPDGFKTECGKTQGSYRIARGREANLNQFPWMAMLLYRNILMNTNKTLHTVCGGSLINNRYVLTAAHCITEPKSQGKELKRVRLGEHNIDSFPDCSNKECAPPHLEIDVKEVIIHEDFKPHTNDIALLRLEFPVRYTNEIQPICLMRGHIALRDYKLEIAGWGITENGTSSHVLLRNTIRENPQYCLNRINIFNRYSQICAGGQNGWDTCKGDSGGPLMATYNIKSTSKEFVFLAGITSYGFEKSCGKINVSAAYTKTGVYFQWIKSKLKP